MFMHLKEIYIYKIKNLLFFIVNYCKLLLIFYCFNENINLHNHPQFSNDLYVPISLY